MAGYNTTRRYSQIEQIFHNFIQTSGEAWSQQTNKSLPLPDGADFKEKLIASVKKEVKQVMEEAVTRKFVHEESGSVTSLCASVEACLSQGLRRRALGLFKTSSTTALLHKVAKVFPSKISLSNKIFNFIFY